MLRPHPPEFRRRAVALALLGDKPKSQIAADLGISDSCLRNWVRQAEIDDGNRPGLSSDERAELVAWRHKNRVLELEVEILKRAGAYFARENVLRKCSTPSSLTDAPICHLVVKIHEQSFGTCGNPGVM